MWRWLSIYLAPITGVFLSKHFLEWSLTFFLLCILGVEMNLNTDIDLVRYIGQFEFYADNIQSLNEVLIISPSSFEIIPSLLLFISLKLGLESTQYFYVLALYYSVSAAIFFNLLINVTKSKRILFIFILLFPFYNVIGYRFWSAMYFYGAYLLSNKRGYLFFAAATHASFIFILLIFYLKEMRIIYKICFAFFLILISINFFDVLIDVFSIKYKGYLEIKETDGGKYLFFLKAGMALVLFLMSVSTLNNRYVYVSLSLISLLLFNLPGLWRLLYVLFTTLVLRHLWNSRSANVAIYVFVFAFASFVISGAQVFKVLSGNIFINI